MVITTKTPAEQQTIKNIYDLSLFLRRQQKKLNNHHQAIHSRFKSIKKVKLNWFFDTSRNLLSNRLHLYLYTYLYCCICCLQERGRQKWFTVARITTTEYLVEKWSHRKHTATAIRQSWGTIFD